MAGNLIEIAGAIGTTCFLIASIPQAWKSIQQGHSDGIALPTISLWVLGEITLLVYVLGKYGFGDWCLLSNYLVNNVTCATILWYKIYPRK